MNATHLFRRALLTSALIVTAGVASGLAHAQAFPARPIKIVVPFPAGGGSDIVARLLAKGMQQRLGQPIIIDNRGGAGTVIGTEAVAKSPADGYTLLWMATPFAINASLVQKLPYDTFKDFVPVVDVVSGPLALVVNSTSPWKTVGDLVAEARRNPNRVTYGSSGNGGSPHLASEMLATAAGVSFVHVPYKGSAPAMNDLLAGQTNFQFDTIILLSPHIQSGKLRALAVSGKTRSQALPNVPTVAESGIAGFEATSWMSLAAPASTPREVLARLNAAANEALKMPEIRDGMVAQGWDVIGGTPESAQQKLAAEIERWGKAVKSSGAKLD